MQWKLCKTGRTMCNLQKAHIMGSWRGREFQNQEESIINHQHHWNSTLFARTLLGHRQSCCICCSCLCCCSVPRTFQVLVQPFKSVSVNLLPLSHIKGISASDMCSWSAERHGTSLIECVCVWPAIHTDIYVSMYLSIYLSIYLI